MNYKQMNAVLFALYHAMIDYAVSVEIAREKDSELLGHYEKLLKEVREAYSIMHSFINQQIN